jgi:alkaline phosphatase
MSYSHMAYETERNPAVEPSLVEMTEKAIKFLSKNENGYFLLVEGKLQYVFFCSIYKKILII